MNEELISALVGVIKVEGLQEATRQINQFTAGMRKSAQEIAKGMGVADKSVKEHQRNFGQMIQANSAQIRTAGRYLAVYGAALTGLVVKGGRDFIQFQREAADVSTMLSGSLGEVQGQMSLFNTGVKNLSIEFNQTTSSLQKGLYDILSASIAPADALKVLGVSSEAATAGLTTVAVAADAITTILNAYAMEAERAGDVSDKLWAIVRRGKVTFEEVASNIGNVASTAAVAGLSFEELGAGIATVTRAGVDHARAMTGMNSVLLAFLKNTDDQKAAAKKFGIELSSLTLKTEGLAGVVKKLSGANEMNRKATAEEIVAIFQNRRALVALLPILQNTAGYMDDVALMTDSAGLAALAFSKVSKTLDFQLGQLGKTIKVVLMEYFEPLAPIIEKIVSVVKYLADAFRNLSPGLKAAISTITLLSGVFLTLSGVILMLTPGIVALAGVIGGPAFLAVGALAAALIGGGGLVAALVQSSQAIKNADTAVHEHIATMRDAEATYKSEQATFDRIIARYKELKQVLATTTPGTEEHTKAEKDLQLVINEITKIVPEAASAWDKYGKAIDVNIEKVERAARVHQQLYDIKQQIRLKELVDEAANLRKQQENRDKEIENIRKQIEKEQGYLEFLSQERERLLNQQGGEDFMSGPQKSIEEFDASWNSMAGTMAGTLSLSLEDIEQGFIKTEASLAKWTEKLLELDQESLAYNLTVKEMAVYLLDLSEKGAVSEEMLAHLLTTVPKLRTEFERLKSEGVKPLDKEFGNLMLTMADVRNRFSTWEEYVDFVKAGALPATKSWKDQVKELDGEVEAAEASLKALYESGQEVDYKDRLTAEEELVAAINKRAEAAKKAKEEEEKAIKELSDDYRDLMRDFQAFQGANTRTTLVEIKKRQAMYEQDADEWKAWEKVRIEYTQAADGEITAIWGKMREEMSNAITGGIKDIMLGKTDLKNMFAKLGESFADSMAEALSKRLEQYLDFEGLLAGPWGIAAGAAFTIMQLGAEGVQEILDGLVASIKQLPELIDQFLEDLPLIITSIIEAIPEIIQAVIDAIPDIIAAIISHLPEIAKALVKAVISMGFGKSGLGIPFDIGKDLFKDVFNIDSFGSIDDWFGDIGDFFKDIFGGFGQHGTTGIEEHMMALEKLAKAETTAAEVIGQLRQMTTGRTGVMSSVDPDAEGAELEHLLTDSFEKRQEWFNKYIEQTGLFSEAEMNEVRDLLKLWEDDTEVSAGNVREAYRTAMQDLGESMRWIGDDLKTASSGWEEAFSTAWDRASTGAVTLTDAYREELKKIPGLTEEMIAELMLIMDQAGGNFEELAKQAGLNIEMGLSYISEASQQALREAGISVQDFGTQVDQVMNSIAAGKIVDFKAALMAIPGMTEQIAAEILESFGIIEGGFDSLDQALFANGESWDEWYDGIAVALNLAGTDLDSFMLKTEEVINQFLTGGMDNLKEALMEIPGMTEEMANQFVQDAEKMKEAGETEFAFSDEQVSRFKESMEKIDKIISESGGIEKWRDNWNAAFKDLDISGLGEKANEAGKKFSDNFESTVSGIDIAGKIDTEPAKKEMYQAGLEAGEEYKRGFEEGASGSGILGDVMWDEDVFQEAFAAIREAGTIAGQVYKEGFSQGGLLEGLTDIDGKGAGLGGLVNLGTSSMGAAESSIDQTFASVLDLFSRMTNETDLAGAVYDIFRPQAGLMGAEFQSMVIETGEKLREGAITAEEAYEDIYRKFDGVAGEAENDFWDILRMFTRTSGKADRNFRTVETEFTRTSDDAKRNFQNVEGQFEDTNVGIIDVFARIEEAFIEAAKRISVTTESPEAITTGSIIAGDTTSESSPIFRGGGRLSEILSPEGITRSGAGGEAQVAGNRTDIKQVFDIKITLPPGSVNDREYWRRLTRENIIPGIEDELSRQGKKLGV